MIPLHTCRKLGERVGLLRFRSEVDSFRSVCVQTSQRLLKSDPVKSVALENNVYKTQYSKFYSEIHKKTCHLDYNFCNRDKTKQMLFFRFVRNCAVFMQLLGLKSNCINKR